MKEEVILVDENDNEIGTMEKMEAHRKGVLHRAFSVCIFNDKGEMLLQKRASRKYHSGGLWTNTCCGHPRPKERVLEAAHRRLKEEMGIDCDVSPATTDGGVKIIGHIIYKASFANGLTEHEYDYVLAGTYNKDPILNKEEAEDFKWASLDSIKKNVKKNPEAYTEWFKILMSKPLFAT